MRTRASEEVSFTNILHTTTSLKYNMNVIDSTIYTMAKLGVITNDYVPNEAHMNQVDSNEVTPLQVACWNGILNVVNLLLPHVDVRKRDNFGRTPFLVAIMGQKAIQFPWSALRNNQNYVAEKMKYVNSLDCDPEWLLDIFSLICNHFDTEWN